MVDIKGTALFDPIQPDLKGKNLIDLKDINGKAFVREFVKTAETQGSGWVDYMWPKPEKTKPSKKSSYLKKVTVKGSGAYASEETHIVGAGIYTD